MNTLIVFLIVTWLAWSLYSIKDMLKNGCLNRYFWSSRGYSLHLWRCHVWPRRKV